jgi:hypothetical protein
VHRGYFLVVPRPMPAAPRRFLIVVARRFSAAVICHRYLIVVPRPLLVKPFLPHLGAVVSGEAAAAGD